MLQKGFIKPKLTIREIGKKRLIAGLFLLAISIFIIFQFLYSFALFIRYLYIEVFLNGTLFLSGEVFPSNYLFPFFIAFISCIWGQSLLINFLFDKPRLGDKRFLKRVNILTENRNLFFVFLATGSELFFVLSFLIAVPFFVEPFRFEMNLIMVLAMIILYFQGWLFLKKIFHECFENLNANFSDFYHNFSFITSN